MESYDDLLKQMGRIDALWGGTDFNDIQDTRIDRANKIFYRYKENMIRHLAMRKNGRVIPGCYRASVWERHRYTKLPRSIYTGSTDTNSTR